MTTTIQRTPLSATDKIVSGLAIIVCAGIGTHLVMQAQDTSKEETFLQLVEEYHPSDTWTDIAGRTLVYDTDALKLEAASNACRFIQDGSDRDYYTQFQGIYDAALEAGIC